MLETIDLISPKSSKVSHFDEEIPIFGDLMSRDKSSKLLALWVLLPSGGEIVMERPKHVSIDVNTGSHKGDRKDGKNFILQANIEAAMEVARQMRPEILEG